MAPERTWTATDATAVITKKPNLVRGACLEIVRVALLTCVMLFVSVLIGIFQIRTNKYVAQLDATNALFDVDTQVAWLQRNFFCYKVAMISDSFRGDRILGRAMWFDFEPPEDWIRLHARREFVPKYWLRKMREMRILGLQGPTCILRIDAVGWPFAWLYSGWLSEEGTSHLRAMSSLVDCEMDQDPSSWGPGRLVIPYGIDWRDLTLSVLVCASGSGLTLFMFSCLFRKADSGRSGSAQLKTI